MRVYGEVMFDVKEQLKTVPEHPGIYIMKDGDGQILYIGKSKSLKKRVTSYFQNFARHPLRIQTMVANVREFEYILTDTEMEALILEANLIKLHKPRFNVLLKDDKAYPYIKVTVDEDFPRVMKTRQVLKDKARYFGPYTSADTVNRTIEIIHKLFPIRKCNRDMRRIAERPCLNYHIHQCLGPCKGDVFKEEYRRAVEDILRFLGGKTEELVRTLENQMLAASEATDFERAAEIRDNIQALVSLRERQKMVSSSEGDQDVIHYAQADTRTCMMIFFIRGGHLIGREQYLIEDSADIQPGELIGTFIQQFYSGTALIPGEILIPVPLDDQELLETWLRGLKGNKIRILIPERGEKKKLVELVGTNAREYLDKFEEKLVRDDETGKRHVHLLQELLQLSRPPYRIEAYDISNLTGLHAVGSMVVYENGRKKNSDYRRFKIKTIEGPNDVGSMQEVLFRRFQRGLKEQALPKNGSPANFGRFPDLLLIDGGKGQVNAVIDVMKALGQEQIPVAGMVKDDFHRTREIYFNGQMWNLGRDDLYRFIAGIQEEVHRFAIMYHRNLRSKAATLSGLDEISGIGRTRRNALLAHFKNMDAIRSAGVDDLAGVPGMNRRAAQKVYDYFRMVKVPEE